MCPDTRHFGLKVVPVWILWGHSVYYLGTWTLRVRLIYFMQQSVLVHTSGPCMLYYLLLLQPRTLPDLPAFTLPQNPVLGGSWVVIIISRVISRVTTVITYIWGLISLLWPAMRLLQPKGLPTCVAGRTARILPK